ncbi:salivary peroxidase/catechol oxidase-like [Diabrotica undecimpunctata]|uniref:salivary peroxidase/catechol oxidase-like n=1 Tax=Diabrotica undecimpunctata TaxID=50387 RepID=UPI003B639FDA
MNQLSVICLNIILVQFTQALLPAPFKFEKPHLLVRSDHFYLSKNEIEDAVQVAKRYTGYLEKFEETIQWPSRIEEGTPAHGLFISQAPNWKGIERGRHALLAIKASAQLSYYCHQEKEISLDTCSDILLHYNFYDSSLEDFCKYLQRNCTIVDELSGFRSINGSCNNFNKGSLGESYTAFERLLPAVYLNNYEASKRSLTKATLPSARKISNAIISNKPNPHESLTMAFNLFGQFIEHDLSSIALSVMIHRNDSFTCCDTYGYDIAPRYKHPLCMPIQISSDDKYYSKKHVHCMNYVRSLPAMGSDCSIGYLEQQNQATHYLDGSQIYGTSDEASWELRTKEGGKLKTSKNNFPYVSNKPQEHCRVKSDQDICFVSGDQRVNLHPQITVMYTLWIREHNRIAVELSRVNKHWDDERVFQEARKIVIAEIQHITYYEWLKHLLDTKYLTIIEKFSKYRDDIDPSVSNAFVTAAIRSMYSMLSENISFVDHNQKEISALILHKTYNKPEVVTKDENFNLILRGLSNQVAQKISNFYSNELNNMFLADDNYGYDIVSLDIQRGRDHGLPGYNDYRKLCGLQKASNFKDFTDVMTNNSVNILSKQYKHVDDVDLLIGGVLEKPLQGSLVGQTFSCIFADQFVRTRRGDRYFYLNSHQPKPFTHLQLSEIKKITLARIFCDNSDIATIQQNVFEKVSSSNKLMSCTSDQIPKLDLSVWTDSRRG